MEQAQCGYPGVVYERALQQGWPGDPLKFIQVALAFSQEPAGQTRKESPYGVQTYVYRRGISKNARVGDHTQKLVNTGSRNTDWLRRRDGFAQHPSSLFMERHLRAMRVDKQIRVDGNHAPKSR